MIRRCNGGIFHYLLQYYEIEYFFSCLVTFHFCYLSYHFYMKFSVLSSYATLNHITILPLFVLLKCVPESIGHHAYPHIRGILLSGICSLILAFICLCIYEDKQSLHYTCLRHRKRVSYVTKQLVK